MKILVIGGNLFFGKKLVHKLIENKHSITVLNRQNNADDFGDKVHRIKCDRLKKEDMQRALGETQWDIVYDQVCYDYQTAKDSCEIFNGKVKHYIHTSSQSVYEPGSEISEDAFIPSQHEFSEQADHRTQYAEAKRQAEKAFESFARFPVSYVRFCIVIGLDDYTKRFLFHINRVKTEKEIFFPNLEAKISFITSQDAANSLYHIGMNQITGPINCCNSGHIALSKLMKFICDRTGKDLIEAHIQTQENSSPYGIDQNWYMDNQKLTSSGLKLGPVEIKVRKLIEESCELS
ncbi:MAG: NAD-dependent dehydratase [Halobacteriovoraceae bacterium]|nr:NAD-dependent dehydratase [Halobacteriovoraceae bacterium]|tara:strand:- start:36632 stop:37504 length:873 start_codon:yes stop_codon:yes gene_type:complete